MTDHLYFFSANSYVYASRKDDFPATSRPHAVLLFSVDGTPLTLRTPRRQFVGGAIAVAPQTVRTLSMSNAGLVSINLPPSSPFFSAFSSIVPPGAHVLERKAFKPFDGFLSGMHEGARKPAQAEEIFHDLVTMAVEQLPRAQRIDTRVLQVLRYLDEEPEASLVELARAFELSPHRMSHLISDSLGLSFRAYQAWRKQVRVCKLLYSGRSLTDIAHEAGLSDSAHLSHFYRHWYGQSPSYSRDRESVKFFS